MAYLGEADRTEEPETGDIQLLRTFKTTPSDLGHPSQAQAQTIGNSAPTPRMLQSPVAPEALYSHGGSSEPSTTEPSRAAGARTLMESTTTAFNTEIGKAAVSALRHIRRVDKHLNPLNHPKLAVSMYLKMFFAGSLLLLLLLITTRIPPINQVIAPDALSPTVRMGLFFVISTLATVPAVLRRLSTASASAQNKLSIIAALYITVLAACVVFAPQLSALDYETRWWAAPVVICTVLAVLAQAALKPFGSIQRLLARAAPLADEAAPAVAAVIYAVITAIAALNLEGSRAFLDRGGIQLPVMLFSFAVTAVVVTAWLIQRIRQLRRDDWRLWEQECRKSLLAAEAAAQAQSMLEKLRTHWFGTALVLTRLVNKPFGARHATGRGRAAVPIESPIRKAFTAAISLGQERETFLQHALPALAPPGWLTAQYHRLSDMYAESEHKRTGDSDPSRPEWCSYPVSLDQAQRGSAHGVRWPFTYKVYSGHYDAILGNTANEASSEAMLRTLHDTNVSIGTDTDTGKPKTLREAFGELLPTESTGRMPGSVLLQQHAKPPSYEPMVWWPERIDPPKHAPRSRERRLGERAQSEPQPFTPKGFCGHVVCDGSTILQAVRVDVSEPLLARELVSPAEAETHPEGQPEPADSADEDGSALDADDYLM